MKIEKISWAVGDNLIAVNSLNVDRSRDINKLIEHTGVEQIKIYNSFDHYFSSQIKIASDIITEFDIVGLPLLVIYITQSNQRRIPSNGFIFANEINLNPQSMILDINSGCSGYPYGLFLAQSLLDKTSYPFALIVTGDMYSNCIDANDISVRSLFSDASSVTLMNRNGSSNIVDSDFGNESAGWEYITTRSNKEEKCERFLMNGPAVFNFTSKHVCNSINSILSKSDVPLNEKILVIPHQASKIMLEHVKTKIRRPNIDFHEDLRSNGNTGSSSIPIALSSYLRDIKVGSSVLLVGFGIGLSYGSVLLEW